VRSSRAHPSLTAVTSRRTAWYALHLTANR
jgi:hypothetical protein